MKNEFQGELSKYDYKSSAAFKKMEELASRLMLENQNLIPVSKIFKEKAQNALKERNQDLINRVYQGPPYETTNAMSNSNSLNLRYEKIKATLDAETKLNEELQVKEEQQLSNFVQRELELEAQIFLASETLEQVNKKEEDFEVRLQRAGGFERAPKEHLQSY